MPDTKAIWFRYNLDKDMRTDYAYIWYVLSK